MADHLDQAADPRASEVRAAPNPAAAYEPSDWRLGAVGLVFWRLGAVGLVFLATAVFLVVAPLLLLAFPGAMPDISRRATVTPPPPRLQVDPVRDLARFRASEERRLDTYYWVDKDKGVVHIPIARAMQLLVERGIDGLPQASR